MEPLVRLIRGLTLQAVAEAETPEELDRVRRAFRDIVNAMFKVLYA